ncbi:MAG TPA: glycosyltransferase [Solirubrobacter sp.]|nr:glycosyltransferase [Solirubrobacter sp.]
MRVLLAPVEAAGVAAAMRTALRERGHGADIVCFAPHPFGYAHDRVADTYVKRLREGIAAPLRYDVLHFQFGTTLCEFIDAAWARLTRRPLVLMHYHGDDCRTRDAVFARQPARARVYDLRPRNDALVRRRLRLASRLCHAAVVADFELVSYLEPWFRTIYVSPAPVTLPALGAPLPPLPGEGPIVLHVPSDPLFKGTAEITAALERLAARRPLRPRIVSGIPNVEVWAEMQRADVVVDQLNSENYAIVTTEAMALGKPVLSEFDPDDLPSFARDVPVVRITPETLDAQLEAICADAERRQSLGRAGAEYVRRVHGPDRLGERLERIYAHAATGQRGVFEVLDTGIERAAKR